MLGFLPVLLLLFAASILTGGCTTIEKHEHITIFATHPIDPPIGDMECGQSNDWVYPPDDGPACIDVLKI
jgi:hypothetical protein